MERLLSAAWCAVLLVPACLAPAASIPAQAAERIAASLARQHRVVLVDPEGTSVVSVPTGLGPHGMLVTGDDRLLVANRGTGRAPSSSLTEIDLRQGRVLRTIFACENCAPTAMALGPDGRLYVSGQAQRAITWFDPPFDEPAGSVLVSWGWPGELAFLESPETLLAGMSATNEIAVTELPVSRPRRLALDLGPERLVRRPGHDEVWVGTRPGRVFVVDAAGLAERTPPPAVTTRSNLIDLAFDGQGLTLLVACASVPGIVLVDAGKREVIGTRVFDRVVTRIEGEPGGRRFAVAFDDSTEIAVLELEQGATLRERARIDLGGEPKELLWIPGPRGAGSAAGED